MNIFVDTSFFVALMKDDDPHYEEATMLSVRSLQRGDDQLYTSFVVIDEVLTVVAMRVSKMRAIEFLNKVQGGIDFPTILDITEDVRERTYQLFRTVQDKNVSTADCFSVALMKHHGIPLCYTFDKHFKKLGVTTL